MRARLALKKPRQSSVFAPPARESLSAKTHKQAGMINRNATGRGITIQSWHISPKIREVDEFLQSHPDKTGQIRESHPEVSFWALNGRSPMQHPKRKAEGFEERLEVLKQYENKSVAVVNAALDRYPLKKVARDDIVDALALAVTAAVSEGDLRVKPILLRIFIKIHHAKFFVTTITGNKLPSAKGTSFKTATFFMIFTLCLFNPNSF